jgi:putative heme-binding domain-containing protein
MEPMSFKSTYLRHEKSKRLIRNLVAPRAIAHIVSACLLLATSTYLDAADQSLEQRLMLEQPVALAAAARSEGDPRRGAIVFHRSMMTCAACHRVGEGSNVLGPNLAKLDKKTSDVALVESILQPSKIISPNYAMVTVETAAGRILTGLPVEQTGEKLVLRNPADVNKPITIKVADIVARLTTMTSIMPTGQVKLLTDRRQFVGRFGGGVQHNVQKDVWSHSRFNLVFFAL